MVKKRRHVQSKHPLVGTWVNVESDDMRAAYTITPSGSGFAVHGVDRYDGEEFVISHVSWDGRSLKFRSHMPSTGRTGRHVLCAISPGKAKGTFSFTETEIWKKQSLPKGKTKKEINKGGNFRRGKREKGARK